MVEDQQLTDHFTLYDMTKTSHADLLEKNRDVNPSQIGRLTALARLLEHVRYLIGPFVITNAYRCPELNAAVGGSATSQHSLCEAADIVPQAMDVNEAFRVLWKDVKERGANVGQLIHETDNGKVWLHVSLGTPYRDAENCKQIMRAERIDGKMVYTRLA